MSKRVKLSEEQEVKVITHQILWIENTSSGNLAKLMTISDDKLYEWAMAQIEELTHSTKVSTEEESNKLMCVHDILNTRSVEYVLGDPEMDAFDSTYEENSKQFTEKKDFFLRGKLNEVELHGAIRTKAPIVLVDSME